MIKRKQGHLELEILSIFQNGKKFSVTDVLKTLGDKDRYTTIMTVMNRLYEKKKLDRVKNKNHYLYFLKEQKAKFSYLKDLIDKAFMGKTSSLVKCLIEDQDINNADLEEIELIIRKAREQK